MALVLPPPFRMWIKCDLCSLINAKLVLSLFPQLLQSLSYLCFLNLCKTYVFFIFVFHFLSKPKAWFISTSFAKLLLLLYLLSKRKACVVSISLVNAHLACCLYFLFCLQMQRPIMLLLLLPTLSYDGYWSKPLH